VKKDLDIVAYEVHSGIKRELVALELDGKCPAQEFLLNLETTNAKGFQILKGQIRFLADVQNIVPRDTFKLLDAARQLYEFRTRSGIRLYCFLVGHTIVLLTNGGKKNTRREQNKDIQKAKQACDHFFGLINKGAELTIIENEDQDQSP